MYYFNGFSDFNSSCLCFVENVMMLDCHQVMLKDQAIKIIDESIGRNKTNSQDNLALAEFWREYFNLSKIQKALDIFNYVVFLFYALVRHNVKCQKIRKFPLIYRSCLLVLNLFSCQRRVHFTETWNFDRLANYQSFIFHYR